MRTYWTIMLFTLATVPYFSHSATIQQHDTVVIHDSGKARPLVSYLSPDIAERHQLRNEKKNNVITPPTNDVDISEILFPLKSEQIKPGRQLANYIPKQFPNLAKSIFIIGTDKYSIDWFKINKQEFVRLNAIGVLAAAESQYDYELLKKLTYPLDLLPSGVDPLIDEFELTTYPILVTPQGLYQ